ncbi:MAG: Ig-like domain-containing protein [Bacillota bacterium]|nr:Ig-like domain-containing protein [Bacillota bacterium]
MATVLPSNATNKNVTWSSSNTNIATVSNGLVSGVSQGNVRITVTTVDGNYTAYCDITITPPITYDYVRTYTLIPGKNYLIANGETGSVYILTNESGGSRILQG